MFLNMTRFSFKKKPQNFSDNSSSCLLLGCWMVWVLSVAHSDEHCRSTIMDTWTLTEESLCSTVRCKSFTPSSIQRVFFFKSVRFSIKKHLSPQHKQVNDKLVQSSRNLINGFCHQGKYVFYETEININNM